MDPCFGGPTFRENTAIHVILNPRLRGLKNILLHARSNELLQSFPKGFEKHAKHAVGILQAFLGKSNWTSCFDGKNLAKLILIILSHGFWFQQLFPYNMASITAKSGFTTRSWPRGASKASEIADLWTPLCLQVVAKQWCKKSSFFPFE